MRMKRLTILLLLLLFAATPLLSQDWAGRGRIQGTVLDENNEPIADATITLHLPGRPDAGPPPIQSNKKGRWSFLGLTGGPWTVIIEKDGYQASEGTMPISEFKSNPNVMRNLKPGGAAAVAAAGGDAAAVAAAEREAELRKQLDDANALLGAGKTQEARTAFQSLVAEVDDSVKAPILLAIAKTHHAEGDSGQAIPILERALQYAPENVEALELVSNLLMSAGRDEEAQVYLARLPEDTQLDPNALLNAGIEKFNAGDITGALAQFDSVVAERPDFAEAYYYRGLCRLQKADNPGALADFQKLLELDPSNPNAGEAQQFVDYLASQ